MTRNVSLRSGKIKKTPIHAVVSPVKSLHGDASTVAVGSKREVKKVSDERRHLWAEWEIISSIGTEPSHVDGVKGSWPLAQGDVGGSIVVLESFMRPEDMWPKERSILVIGGVAIAGDPRPVLPEACIGLLVPEEIVVIRVWVGSMHGEVIRRLESEVRPTETGAWGIRMKRQVETGKRGIVHRGDVNSRVFRLLCEGRRQAEIGGLNYVGCGWPIARWHVAQSCHTS